MKRFILVLTIILAGISLNAQKLQEDAFLKANAYYNESKYDSALVVYSKIIEEGYISAPILYNMGNSHFKMRNYPMAILYYEKSLKLDPKNEDVKKNLEIANALITDKIEPLPTFFMTRWWHDLSNILTADGWAIFSIVMFAILLLAVFLYLTARSKAMKKSMFFTSIITLVLCVISITFASRKSSYIKSNNEAIIMKPTITVKSSPSSSGVDLFVLHEGTKVEITEVDGNWDKIRIADGSVGWMPEESLARF